MRKILGYIPLEEGESPDKVKMQTAVVRIEGQLFKLADVWVPGVSRTASEIQEEGKVKAIMTGCGLIEVKEEVKPKVFEALESQRAVGLYRICKHCGRIELVHINKRLCP